MRVLALGGSLRERSRNRTLLDEAAALVPPGTTLDLTALAVVGSLPLFNQDVLERDGLPPGAMALKDALQAADGLLIATPEYNWGVPGYLKNAIDWASRPSSDVRRVFGDLPVAVIGAGGGSARATHRRRGCRCSATSRCGRGSINGSSSTVPRNGSTRTAG